MRGVFSVKTSRIVSRKMRCALYHPHKLNNQKSISFFILMKGGCCTVLQLKIFLWLSPVGNHFKAMQGSRMAFSHWKSQKHDWFGRVKDDFHGSLLKSAWNFKFSSEENHLYLLHPREAGDLSWHCFVTKEETSSAAHLSDLMAK